MCCDSWPVEGVMRCCNLPPGVLICSPQSRALLTFINSESVVSECLSCSCVSGDVKVSELVLMMLLLDFVVSLVHD